MVMYPEAGKSCFKMKYIYIFFLICTTAFSQEINIAKDTIQMREVVVSENFRNFKSSKVKIKGNCRNPETMDTVTEIVTLVDKLPLGYLESVTFYFNEMYYMSYKRDHKDFEDTEFEVVLYKVNADNTPGERIMRDEKYILIMKEHAGEAKVHFLDFNIKNVPKMFIGLRRTSPKPASRKFYIDCVCNTGSHVTYSKTTDALTWNRYSQCPAIKMAVNVLVSPE